MVRFPFRCDLSNCVIPLSIYDNWPLCGAGEWETEGALRVFADIGRLWIKMRPYWIWQARPRHTSATGPTVVHMIIHSYNNYYRRSCMSGAATPNKPEVVIPEFKQILGHPGPLWMLFMTEFWER